MSLSIEIARDRDEAARLGAGRIAGAARDAIATRGTFRLALSGGATPAGMLRTLAREDLPWTCVHVFQVDERAATEGHPDRNLTQLRESLADAPLPPGQLHPMPVEEIDLETAARAYERLLVAVAGRPPLLDLAHLGLGKDGHTASLAPGDPVLEVSDAFVAPTSRPYAGRRRLTLTYPTLAHARSILWLVTGAEKAQILDRLIAGDPSIPASRVRRDRAIVIADGAAAWRKSRSQTTRRLPT